jgi:hypothetical protein
MEDPNTNFLDDSNCLESLETKRSPNHSKPERGQVNVFLQLFVPLARQPAPASAQPAAPHERRCSDKLTDKLARQGAGMSHRGRRYAPRSSERVSSRRYGGPGVFLMVVIARSSSCDHKPMTKQDNEVDGAFSSKIERQVKLMKI